MDGNMGLSKDAVIGTESSVANWLATVEMTEAPGVLSDAQIPIFMGLSLTEGLPQGGW